MGDEELISLINGNVQRFIKEQVELTDKPLTVAGCLAAQLHHFYVALIGEEDTGKMFEQMSHYKPKTPTMH